MSRAGRLDHDVVVGEPTAPGPRRRRHTAGWRTGWPEPRLRPVRKDLRERYQRVEQRGCCCGIFGPAPSRRSWDGCTAFGQRNGDASSWRVVRNGDG
jgi:hypothetical protein